MPNIGQHALTRLERMNRYGYYIEDNIFNENELSRVRAATERLIREGYKEYGRPEQDYYPNVIEFDEAFAEVLDNRLLLEGMQEVIGPDLQLYANEVIVSKPSGQAGGWHRDKMSIGKFHPNIFIKVFIFLSDVATDGGATGVVPESNLDLNKGEEFYPYKIEAPFKAGEMLVWGANTMHRAGLHIDGRPHRPVLSFVFVPWWAKQADYYTGNKCAHLIENASPMRLQLIGVKMRAGINMDL
jgi:ectoine hydroxylase-related dioxygenase (phytanoyl-CoA dioxygenase family)